MDCHPERSEGSAFPGRMVLLRQTADPSPMAQDDNIER
jgi:hypothetical protein